MFKGMKYMRKIGGIKMGAVIKTIDEIEILLKESEEQLDNPETIYLTHEEVFEGAWKLLNDDRKI